MFASTLPVTLIVLVRSPAQPSDAVAPGSVKTVPHSTVMGLAPLKVSTGATVSATLINTVSSSEPPPEDETFSVMVWGPDDSETVGVGPVPTTVVPSDHV